ncbi:hypothetical protein JAO73_10605 [Hymenobacter sp. BT523]|uniref:hypothetical protein n=1 Tax=Hymenobacter sp. BT523 TaxID=2795725 RepID=UPI0018EC9A5A|nr:hypothetical protein [Hymenobacter sp. BT523]MBJ6109466.1 hypothetical protein [Hymenobacter sp. BT523]
MRAFSEAIGDSSSNTNNYIGSRQTEPKPEYLSKVVNHFRTVNAHWLLTGEGEPFLSYPQTGTTQTGYFNQAGSGNKQSIKGSKGKIQAGSDGTNVALENCQRDLAAATKEIESLRQQLTMAQALLEAKEETLSLLRSQYNRPN